MNATPDIAKFTDSLKAAPFVTLAVINIIVLVGFGYVLSQVSEAQERRDAMIKACIERK